MRKKKTEPKEPKVLFQEQIVTTGQLATVVGKTSRWINELTNEGALKQVARGKYALGQAIQDYIEHVMGGKEDSKKPKLIDFKTLHEKTKAEKAELELELLKGRLHDAREVEALLSDLILTTKSRLLSVASRVADDAANESPEVVERIVREEIEVALSSLAKYTPGQIGGVNADESAGT